MSLGEKMVIMSNKQLELEEKNEKNEQDEKDKKDEKGESLTLSMGVGGASVAGTGKKAGINVELMDDLWS